MAVLGSTVDPRLGAVSPAAIQALSQAGAATGQMYSNIGRSLAGVIQDQAQRKVDATIAGILAETTVDAEGRDGEKTGFKTIDQERYRELVKEKKVPTGIANTILKDTIDALNQSASIIIADREADIKDRAQESTASLAEQKMEQDGLLTRQGFNLELEIAKMKDRTQTSISENELNFEYERTMANLEAEKERLVLSLESAKERDKSNFKAQLERVQKTIDANKAFVESQTRYYDARTRTEMADATGSDTAFFNEPINPTSVNQLSEILGFSADEINAKDPIEMAQILDTYTKNLGRVGGQDSAISFADKMRQGYERRAAAKAAREGRIFNPDVEIPYRAAAIEAAKAVNASAQGLNPLPFGGNFGDSITFGEALQDRAGEAVINLGQKAATGVSNFIKSADLSMPKMDPQDMSGSYSLGRFN